MTAETFFGRDGRLARALAGYEERPAQQRFAEAVDRVLKDGGLLLAEAGTGTGKTLAYLLPAVELGRPLLVAGQRPGEPAVTSEERLGGHTRARAWSYASRRAA